MIFGAVPVQEEELPLTLPEVEKYEPTGTGESPLADIEDWVNCKCPVCGKDAKRETNTMPQWAGSSWYFLRYIDNKIIWGYDISFGLNHLDTVLTCDHSLVEQFVEWFIKVDHSDVT